jgi:hypothetical protein
MQDIFAYAQARICPKILNIMDLRQLGGVPVVVEIEQHTHLLPTTADRVWPWHAVADGR